MTETKEPTPKTTLGPPIYVRLEDELKYNMSLDAATAGASLSHYIRYVLSMSWIPEADLKWLRKVAEEEGRTPLQMLAFMVKLEHQKDEAK